MDDVDILLPRRALGLALELLAGSLGIVINTSSPKTPTDVLPPSK